VNISKITLVNRICLFVDSSYVNEINSDNAKYEKEMYAEPRVREDGGSNKWKLDLHDFFHGSFCLPHGLVAQDAYFCSSRLQFNLHVNSVENRLFFPRLAKLQHFLPYRRKMFCDPLLRLYLLSRQPRRIVHRAQSA
jgi:hypothetical protein